jgi:protein-L-isoaspartate(D-aspartate) O-methyltransferase
LGSFYARQRAELVSRELVAQGIQDPRVLAAMRRVPRHRFVPWYSRLSAYADQPLWIGHGQSISQPYIVAYMTEAAAPTAQDRCLEIGTGSGYQAAVLAELCCKVFSVELLPDLAELGRRNLRAAGYGPDRVALRTGDGYLGWPEQAPFDVVIVTAAPPHVPEPLLEQLAVGGRLIVPVGPAADTQSLERWTRKTTDAGRQELTREELLPVLFVPLVRDKAGG